MAGALTGARMRRLRVARGKRFDGAARAAYRRLKRVSPRVSGFLEGISEADAIVSRLVTQYDVMAYFATSPDSLYQIRQWIAPSRS